MQHFLTELDLDLVQLQAILDDAAELKRTRGRPRDDLRGRTVALYFEKPSVRTRTSFTVGVQELGGWVVELSSANTKVGKGEEPEDFARVLGRYVHALVARVFQQEWLRVLAGSAGIPVINALSDERHPCQALADAMTIIERRGPIAGQVFTFVGEGNNVAASTGLLLAALGAEVRVASPEGYGLADDVLEEARNLAGTVRSLVPPDEAVEGADVIYTDTWISMGQEAEAEARRKVFRGYRVDDRLLQRAKSDAIVMHCLPAVPGEEIDGSLMTSDASAIWDQAENRLHVQKALLRALLPNDVDR